MTLIFNWSFESSSTQDGFETEHYHPSAVTFHLSRSRIWDAPGAVRACVAWPICIRALD
jgi:hypothetical protein